MVFETFGKLFSSPSRSILFFSSLFIPPFLIALFLFFQLSSLQDLENRFAEVVRKGKLAAEKKLRKEQFLSRYSRSAPFFLDQQIEALSFLQKEREQLKKLLLHPAFSDKRLVQERLQFLIGEENRLAFAEEKIRSSPQVKETEEKQRHSVQVDESDLKLLLRLIEDTPPDLPLQRPQFLILDFHVRKNHTPFSSEVLDLEMELLKREFEAS